jgi:hypothetical protein
MLSIVLSVAVAALLALSTATVAAAEAPAPPPETVEEALDVAPVWAGHPVGFALLTHKGRQFVAFYDDQRRMTVGERGLGDKAWRFVRLPETVGWDSHNYITLTADDDGQLHLSGNLHVNPIVYFRTTKPLDISTFERVSKMVGSNEARATYPQFFRGPSNELIFTYRDGSSGDGDQIYNVYDHKTRTWSRLLDRPLTDGEGERNAYLAGPTKGPDGYFHLLWVWRETPDAASNHDPSYARSKDLRHWERSDGTPLALPITLKTGEIIDPVPVRGGIINGNVKLGFDRQKRVVVGYHKYDGAGNIQIYNARREKDGWKVYQTSDWNWRWEFGGGGSIPFEVGLGPVQASPDGTLTQAYTTAKHGSGTWVLDEATLKPVGTPAQRPAYPPEIAAVTSAFPGMRVNWSGGGGKSGEEGVRYVLRWETLGQNRDRPRTGPLPEPSMLRLYKLRTPTVVVDGPLAQLQLPAVPRKPWRFKQFPIIAWWGPPGTARREDFQAYKDAGFTLYAANPDTGYEQALEHAAHTGLKVMAYRQAQGFGLPPKPADYTTKREQIVGWLTNDEPSGVPAITASIIAVNSLMREDPTRQALFNLLPPGAQNNPATDPIIEAAVRNGMPILSYDSYVIHADGHDNAEAHYRYLDQFRRASLQYDVPFWAFALTIKHFGYRRSSESDLRWTHYTNLAYGAKGLWYFTYWGPTDWPNWDRVAIVDPKDGGKTALYEQVKALNHAVLGMGDTLVKLSSTGVFHTSPPPPGQQAFSPNAHWISDLRATDALIGFFQHADGKEYAMMVNKRHGMNKSAAETADQIELTFAPSVRAVTAVNWLDGTPGPIKITNGKVLLRVAGGTGVLLRLDRSAP